MWTLVILLIFTALILFFIYKKGNRKTKEAKAKFLETEQELEGLRKRSLEREQKIRRELQDEINKNRSTRTDSFNNQCFTEGCKNMLMQKLHLQYVEMS